MAIFNSYVKLPEGKWMVHKSWKVSENPWWGFPYKWGYPNSWMVKGKSNIQVDDLGVPPFMETLMLKMKNG